MKDSNFRIVPLATDVAEQARRAAEAGVADHAIITVAKPDEAPCRHCLRWAQPGERVILFPYTSIPADRPYSDTGPIFVHLEACERYARTEKFPADFRRNRVLRTYDCNDNMIDAQVVESDDIEEVIETLLTNPKTAFLQARNVSRGCYTMRLERD
jgi:Protein of unknown function (DUF1203)